jgi:hypothetical protein
MGVWFPVGETTATLAPEEVDPVEQLKTMDIDDAYEYVAGMLGVRVRELKSKYSKLNVGMQRMNLGNRLRGHLSRNK